MPCQHTIQSSANEHPNGYSTTNTWAGTQNEATKTEARLLDKKCVPWVYVLLRLLKAKNGKSTREDKRCRSGPNVFRFTMVWYFNSYITCLQHVLRYPTSLPIGSSAASALACFRWAIPRVMACFPRVPMKYPQAMTVANCWAKLYTPEPPCSGRRPQRTEARALIHRVDENYY